MIVAMQDQATEENIQQVIERMVELGFNVHRTTGAAQTILAGVGTPEHFEVAEFKVLAGVYDAYRISSPYKLAGRSFRPGGTTITFPNGVVVGDGRPLLGGVAGADSDQRKTGCRSGGEVFARRSVQTSLLAL
jgi:DAHP synthase ferredoxin-like domain